jgi:hypothetical protein
LKAFEKKIEMNESATINQQSIASQSDVEPLRDVNPQFSSLVRTLAQNNSGSEASIHAQIDEILDDHHIMDEDLGWVYVYAARDGVLERMKKIELKCQIENFHLRMGLYLAVKMQKKDVIKHLLSGPLNGCSLEMITNMVKVKTRDSIDSSAQASWYEILDLLSTKTSIR